MRKLLLLGSILFLSFAEARMLDAIAIIVEGEPITTAEIRAIKTQMGVSDKQAREMLIQDRLQKSAIKDIEIDEKRIDEKITSIAKQNNLTVPKMQKILKQQGTSWTKYRKSIREALKKEKFFQKNILASIPTPTEEELKRYYNNHKEDFVAPSSVSLIEYSAKTEAALKNFLTTKKLTSSVHSKKVTKKTKGMNSALLGSILQTQDGSYTRPLNAGDRYISYKVLSKNGQGAMPFEAAQGAVGARWKQEQENKAMKDYFQKLKTNADVQVIR